MNLRNINHELLKVRAYSVAWRTVKCGENLRDSSPPSVLASAHLKGFISPGQAPVTQNCFQLSKLSCSWVIATFCNCSSLCLEYSSHSRIGILPQFILHRMILECFSLKKLSLCAKIWFASLPALPLHILIKTN